MKVVSEAGVEERVHGEGVFPIMELPQGCGEWLSCLKAALRILLGQSLVMI
jgi:hypothetical protein